MESSNLCNNIIIAWQDKNIYYYYIHMNPKTNSRSTRKDKLKNTTLVSSAIAKNPLASERTIAKQVGLSKTAVHYHLQKIDQSWPVSWVLQEMLSRDLQIVELWQRIIYDRMMNDPACMKNTDIVYIMRECTTRFNLFRIDQVYDYSNINFDTASVDELLVIVKKGRG